MNGLRMNSWISVDGLFIHLENSVVSLEIAAKVIVGKNDDNGLYLLKTNNFMRQIVINLIKKLKK